MLQETLHYTTLHDDDEEEQNNMSKQKTAYGMKTKIKNKQIEFYIIACGGWRVSIFKWRKVVAAVAEHGARGYIQ
jgi:hypothetical protein